MDVFSTLKAMPNKLLNKDGSITDFKGNIITPADPVLAEVYNRSKSIANKFLNSDDEIKTYAEISVEIFEVVDVLPEIGEKNKIYLVPSKDGMFDEYFYNSNEQWDKIGEVSIDLSNYPNREEVANAIAANSTADRQYVDEQLKNIHSYYDWDGKSSDDNPENLALWKKIYEESFEHNVLVTYKEGSNFMGIAVINKTIWSHYSTNTKIIYWNTPVTGGITASTVGAKNTIQSMTSEVSVIDNELTWIGSIRTSNAMSLSFLPTNPSESVLDTINFTPTEAMHPATKQYVDDTIKTNITDVLGGEY